MLARSLHFLFTFEYNLHTKSKKKNTKLLFFYLDNVFLIKKFYFISI